MASPGRCNFQNHLQPKHDRGAAQELFLKMGTNKQLHKYAHKYTPSRMRMHACPNTHAQLHAHTGVSPLV